MVFQDFERWGTNSILYYHNLQGTIHILSFPGIEMYWLFANKWVIGQRSKIFCDMVNTFTMKFLYQGSICLSEIWIVEKARENYQEIQDSAFHSMIGWISEAGYFNYIYGLSQVYYEWRIMDHFSTNLCLIAQHSSLEFLMEIGIRSQNISERSQAPRELCLIPDYLIKAVNFIIKK